ncbi:MAG: hypothetical protein ACI83P_002274 [Janthinobacterium sp.]|jgi:hypothetical protein
MRAMAKRFLYAIALAVIFQLSWGVASAYCMHESGQASAHFGHHQHEHTPLVSAVDDDANPASKKSAVHADCASCFHYSPSTVGTSVELASPLLVQHQRTPAPYQPPKPYLGLPERPQWPIAA